MNRTMKFCLILLMAFGFLTILVNASTSRPPRNNDISNMAEALKYLQDLDTYYGDRARVRYGKRTPFGQIFRNHLFDGSDMVRNLELSPAEEPF